MTRIVALLAPVLLLLSALPLSADTVRDLYSAEVMASGRTQSALDKASREALSQVLVKVSGSDEVLSYPSIRSAAAQSRSLVQQYSFLEKAAEGGGVKVLFEFSGPAIVELVKSAGAPLWTANRPVVLTWLTLDAPQGPQFVSFDSAPELSEALLAAFSRRGLPMEMPLFDLADSTALRAEEVQRFSEPAVELASRRYQREDVLIGRLTPVGTDQFSAQWSYLSSEGRLDTSVGAASPAVVMDAGVALLADDMAARFAVQATESDAGGILMSVVGIDAYADYAAVLSWLEGIELIESVRVMQVQGDRVQLRLQAQADVEQLAGILGLNERLEPVSSGYLDDQLSYRWQN